MRPNRIILVRHGESEGNADKYQYKTVPDYALMLTPNGIAQARQAGNEIKEIIGAENILKYICVGSAGGSCNCHRTIDAKAAVCFKIYSLGDL